MQLDTEPLLSTTNPKPSSLSDMMTPMAVRVFLTYKRVWLFFLVIIGMALLSFWSLNRHGVNLFNIQTKYLQVQGMPSSKISIVNNQQSIVNNQQSINSNLNSKQQKSDLRVSRLSRKIDVFSNSVKDFSFYVDTCLQGKTPSSIEDLTIAVESFRTSSDRFCSEIYKIFSQIYNIRSKETTIVISDTFMERVEKWLNKDQKMIEASKRQGLIFVDNKLTQESVVYNPVRANRPGAGGADALNFINKLVTDSSANCDFCQYKKYTAMDSFGRLESKHASIVSNTFKIERYHGMVLFRHHDPLNVSQHEFIDGANLAMKFFEKAHSLVPDHEYRIIYWDVLPKASASQVHPHMHLTLGDYSYYAKWNRLHHASVEYAVENKGRNYWTQLLKIHNALGLAVQFGEASAFAYITPQKDYELVVISRKPCLDYFRLVYLTMRILQFNMHQYAISFGMVFPRINSNPDADGYELPMMCRMVSRGPADNPRSDISSFDLFGLPNVNKDPFKLMAVIKEELKKRTLDNADFKEFWTYS